MGRPAEVTAVVVNLNGGERVLGCLRALRDQETPPSEIIAVDNGSTDGSPERIHLEFPGVRLERLGENRGPSVARNVGLRLARCERVLLVDHDIYLRRDALRELLERPGANADTALCPRIVYHVERDTIQCDGATPHFIGTLRLLRGEAELAGAPVDPVRVGGGLASCLLLPKSEALTAGGFDEEYFFYFEDLEFCLRLASRGIDFECVPAAVAYHDRGAGYAGLSFRRGGSYPAHRFYLTVRNRLLTIGIHYRARTIVLLWPAFVVYDLASLALALRRGWLGRWVQAWFWPLRHWRLLREKRRRAQSARTCSDRDLLRGGPLPLAPGLVKSRLAAALVAMLSGGLNVYWSLVRRWIG